MIPLAPALRLPSILPLISTSLPVSKTNLASPALAEPRMMLPRPLKSPGFTAAFAAFLPASTAPSNVKDSPSLTMKFVTFPLPPLLIIEPTAKSLFNTKPPFVWLLTSITRRVILLLPSTVTTVAAVVGIALKWKFASSNDWLIRAFGSLLTLATFTAFTPFRERVTRPLAILC